MKKIYSIFFLALSTLLFGQVLNVSVQDCNNVSSSIYDVLSSGKVLFVASEGLDCSNCKAQAPGLQNWAAQNDIKIQVWGAMTYTYNNNTPGCGPISNWVSTYGWDDIYTFIDGNRYWLQSGTPRYVVYDPSDSTIAYQGFSESTAMTTAENLAANSTVGLNETSDRSFYVSQSDEAFKMHHLPKGAISMRILSLTGQQISAENIEVSSDAVAISTARMNAGIYLVGVQNNSGFRAVRKIHVK